MDAETKGEIRIKFAQEMSPLFDQRRLEEGFNP